MSKYGFPVSANPPGPLVGEGILSTHARSFTYEDWVNETEGFDVNYTASSVWIKIKNEQIATYNFFVEEKLRALKHAFKIKIALLSSTQSKNEYSIKEMEVAKNLVRANIEIITNPSPFVQELPYMGVHKLIETRDGMSPEMLDFGITLDDNPDVKKLVPWDYKAYDLYLEFLEEQVVPGGEKESSKEDRGTAIPEDKCPFFKWEGDEDRKKLLCKKLQKGGFLECDEAEFIRLFENGTATKPPKWKKKEALFAYFINELADKFAPDSYDDRWAIAANRFVNKSGNPYKNKQIANVYWDFIEKGQADTGVKLLEYIFEEIANV